MSKNYSNYSKLGGLEPFRNPNPPSKRVLLASLYPMMYMFAILKIVPNVIEFIDDYSDFLDSQERKDKVVAAVRARRNLP